MATITTRAARTDRWRTVRALTAATLAVSTLQILTTATPFAQTKATSKNQITAARASHAAPAAAGPDVQAFAIPTDGSVADQLTLLKVDPADAQAAAQAVSQAMATNEVKVASSGRAVLESQGAGHPKRLATLQIYSNSSLAIELQRGADGAFGFKLAPNATENDDERVSSVPSAAGISAVPSRSLIAASITSVKTTPAALTPSLTPSGVNPASVTDLSKAITYAAADGTVATAKIEVVQGRTADGAPHLLYASLGDKDRRAIWWFAPPSEPEGWFDDQGRRLGSSALGEPLPGARTSSPFGGRRYYGRKTGGGFHNGIDFEGKTGEPIYAAADGVINHQDFYFNYGRTVKITHSDGFETLYAHMSRFNDNNHTGTKIHKGDLIGYVGATGRAYGSHLHFSTIVNGQFVDPAPYLAGQAGPNGNLSGESLVVFRQWQQEVRTAVVARSKPRGLFDGFRNGNVQGADDWSRNPFVNKTSAERQW
jgi:murein DD-endopeptidase MepM/ murein hydrolase activator NlpD